jgi:hypothetical protein
MIDRNPSIWLVPGMKTDHVLGTLTILRTEGSKWRHRKEEKPRYSKLVEKSTRVD